jgi:hypothetical protein
VSKQAKEELDQASSFPIRPLIIGPGDKELKIGRQEKLQDVEMMSKEILRQCQEELIKRFGGLSDLPRELANTIANLYYKHFTLKKDHEESKILPKSLEKYENIFDGMPHWIEDHETVFALLPMMPEIVKFLRGIDKVKQPNYYKMWVETFLDTLKYKITNAPKKSGIRRMIERRFRAKHVREIPNLIDLL